MEQNTALNNAKTNMEMARNISHGIPPSNPQIATILEGTERALHSTTLPPESQKVSHDAAVLVDDMKQVLLEKNKDENIQGIIKDMGMMGIGAAQQAQAAGLPAKAKGLVQGQAAQGTMQQGMDSVKLLAKALVRNQDFRTGLKDMLSTLQWAFYQRSSQVRQDFDNSWAGDRYYSYYTTYAAPTIHAGGIPATVTPIATTSTAVPPLPPKTPTTEIQKKLSSLRPMTQAELIEFRTRLFTSLLALNRTPELRTAMGNFYSVLSWVKSQALSAKAAIKQTGTGTGTGGMGFTAAGVPITIPTTTTTATAGITSPPDFKSVMKRFQRLIEEFTGSKSLDDLVFYSKEFISMMKNDENLRSLLHDYGTFGTEFIQADYQTMDQIPANKLKDFDFLLQRTDNTFIGLANHYVVWRLLEEMQQVAIAIRDDPLRQKLATDTKVLLEDFIYYDSMGKPQLNTQVMSQLKYLVLPILKEHLAYIPLPRIEGSDEKMDYWIDNVILTTTDILPDNMKIDVRSKTKMNRPGLTGSTNNVIRLALDNVKINLKDVRFWYRRKTFPKMTDEGFVDFNLTRNGLRITLELLANFSSETDIFTVNRVKVSADRLKVKIHESKHDFLYSIVLGLFKGRMKREIELKTEESIRNNFGRINTSLGSIARTVAEKRGQASGTIASKTAGPIANAIDTYVHPSSSH